MQITISKPVANYLKTLQALDLLDDCEIPTTLEVTGKTELLDRLPYGWTRAYHASVNALCFALPTSMLVKWADHFDKKADAAKPLSGDFIAGKRWNWVADDHYDRASDNACIIADHLRRRAA